MFTLLIKLYRTRLLTIAGLYRLLEAVLTTGVNLMVLLRVAAKLHPERTAVVDEQERLTYPELWRQAEALAGALHAEHGIKPGQKVAIACGNHAAAIKAIFAFSRLGTRLRGTSTAEIAGFDLGVDARRCKTLVDHIEWMTPPPKGTGQERGNSGVYLMSRYELQVLDSYQNETYPDGQAGAIYGQFPPLVNASRPPGEWQSYDIVFRGPRFDSSGALLRPATMTVRHNGVLVQDNVTLTGPVGHYQRPPYVAHPEKQPLLLQDHGNPVRFRYIWLRELK